MLFSMSFQHSLTIAFGLAIAMLSSATYASHSWGQWAEETLIETDNTGNASAPQIAMNANGNAIAVWTQYDGKRTNILANRYTIGSGWGAAILIETNNAGGASNPQIAMNANGTAITVWTQYDGGRRNIWANRYTAGSGWGAATLIETDNVGNASAPQVTMNANGNAIAVWQQFDGAHLNIWANHYILGSGWGIATLIETDNIGGAFNPEIIMNANGNAVAVWMQYDGTRYNVWANRYIAGSGWEGATLIETDNTGGASNPQIAMNANGNAIAVWQQYDGVRFNIWANRYTVGSGWGIATLIETNNGNVNKNLSPQIAMDNTGNAIAVWTQSDDERDNIWANHYTSGGSWGIATLIETDNAGSASSPQITMDASGNAIAVWAQSTATDTYNIWANRYATGRGWVVATLVETDNAGSASSPQIAMNANGNAVAVWQQNDGTRSNIWAGSASAYHWARTANPFTLKLDDNLTSSDWKSTLAQAVRNWNSPQTFSTTSPATTVIQAGQSNRSCAMIAGTMQVCNGSYGNNGWLGLASINVINFTHITQGYALVNDTYFNTPTYNNPNEKLRIMCQDIAHTFGLGHQSENGSSHNTCMDFFSNTGVNAASALSTTPNLHDFDQLKMVYAHLDGATSLAAMTAVSASATEPTEDQKNWGQLKSQSSNGRSSTYEKHNADGSQTMTQVYWTIEAAADCSSCDHRYGQ